MRYSKVKYFLIIIFAVILLFAASACDMGEDEPGVSPDYYTLEIGVEGEGETDPAPGEEHEYQEDTLVDISVEAAEDWIFERWEGPDKDNLPKEEVNQYSILMDSNKEMTAIFVEEDEKEESYSVSGQVIDTEDNPLEGVEITFDRGMFSSVTTDEQGFWQKEDLVGEVEVRARKDGYSYSPGYTNVNEAEEDIIFVGNLLKPGQEDIIHTERSRTMTKSQAEQVEELSDDGQELIFREKTDYVESLSAGDILTSEYGVPGAEEGLLKRVEAVNGRTVKVEPAMLDEVIEEGKISGIKTVTFQDILSGMEKAEDIEIMRIDEESKEIDFKVNKEGLIMEEEEDPEEGFDPFDGLEGTVKIVAERDIKVEAGFFSGLEHFELVFEPGVEVFLTFEIEKGFEDDFDENLTPEILVGVIPIYPPVTLNFYISLVAEGELNLSGKFETGISYDRRMQLGAKYDGKNWHEIKNISSGEFDPLDPPPTLSGSIDFNTGAGMALDVSAGVARVGEAGVESRLLGKVGGDGMAEFDFYNREFNWGYDVYLFLEGSFTAYLSLLRIAELEHEFPSMTYPDPKLNIFYGASGQVKFDTEPTNMDEVKIDFRGRGTDDTKLNEEGHWRALFLSGPVEIVPEHDEYNFEPSSKIISSSRSDIEFKAIAYEPEVSIEGIEVSQEKASFKDEVELIYEVDNNISEDKEIFLGASFWRLDVEGEEHWFSDLEGDKKIEIEAHTKEEFTRKFSLPRAEESEEELFYPDKYNLDVALWAEREGEKLKDEYHRINYMKALEVEGENELEIAIVPGEDVGSVEIKPDRPYQEFASGEEVELQVVAEWEHWEFVKWEGNVEDKYTKNTSIMMEEDEKIGAVFEDQRVSEYIGRVVIDGESPNQPVDVMVETPREEDPVLVETDGSGHYEIPQEIYRIDEDMIEVTVPVSRTFSEDFMKEVGLATHVTIAYFEVEEGEWELPDIDLYGYGFELLQPENEAVIPPLTQDSAQVKINEYERNVRDLQYFMYFVDPEEGEWLGQSYHTFQGDNWYFDGYLWEGGFLEENAQWYVSALYRDFTEKYIIHVDTWGHMVYLDNEEEKIENIEGLNVPRKQPSPSRKRPIQ